MKLIGWVLILFLGGINLPLWAKPLSKACQAKLETPDKPEVQAAKIWAMLEDFWLPFINKTSSYRLKPTKLILFDEFSEDNLVRKSNKNELYYMIPERTAYLTFEFWETFEKELGAKGDGARIFSLAHEYAHHIQAEMGYFKKRDLNVMRVGGVDDYQWARLSLFAELTADALAGFFMGYLYQTGIIDDDDLKSALSGARAVGDDHVAYVKGRLFDFHLMSHGTSQMRLEWFRKGFLNETPLSELDASMDVDLLAALPHRKRTRFEGLLQPLLKELETAWGAN